MVRHAAPLVLAPTLPPVDNRIEMLIAEGRLLHPAAIGVEETEEPLLTVLVSFDPTHAERGAARALASSFIAAACSFEQAPVEADLGTWLTATLRRLPASSVCVVIALPDYSSELECQLQTFIDTIRRTGHHYAALVVSVATVPAHWSALGLDGFVIGEPEQRVTGALQVFSMLAAMMAPGLMCCLDADDFRCALGTATSPSRIAHAVYFPDDSSFKPASRIDSLVLANAPGVAVMPGRCLRILAQSRLVAAVRAGAQLDAALTIVAPWGLAVEPVGAGSTVDVLLICRAAAPTPNQS